MKIYHTSPEKIEKINDRGIFGGCLFFSDTPYFMSGASKYIYSIDIDEDEVVSVGELCDEEIIEQISDYFDIDEDTAERVLDGRVDAFQVGGDGEDDWFIQGLQGECARKMGYIACRSRDEQGTVYIVHMMGREDKLNLEEVRD